MRPSGWVPQKSHHKMPPGSSKRLPGRIPGPAWDPQRREGGPWLPRGPSKRHRLAPQGSPGDSQEGLFENAFAPGLPWDPPKRPLVLPKEQSGFPGWPKPSFFELSPKRELSFQFRPFCIQVAQKCYWRAPRGPPGDPRGAFFEDAFAFGHPLAAWGGCGYAQGRPRIQRTTKVDGKTLVLEGRGT